MSDNPIVPISFYADSIDYDDPNNDYVENKTVANQIKNAWGKSCAIDRNGHLWITDTYLHLILRTTKENAIYYVLQLEKKLKRADGNLTYIRGSEIIRIIDERMQNAGEIKKEKNLRYSFDMYTAIRDSPQVSLLRAEYYESIKNYKKRLKKVRINEFGITHDELTGKILDSKGSHFSHIRSCSIYPFLIDNIYNGHIVNDDTHSIITYNTINDENGLYDLCVKMGWNTDWYDDYVNYFGTI